VGFIPMLLPATHDPERTLEFEGPNVYMPGLGVDPNDDYWGTASCKMKVKFYSRGHTGLDYYSFRSYLTSWLGVQIEAPPSFEIINRNLAVTIDRDFQFSVNW